MTVLMAILNWLSLGTLDKFFGFLNDRERMKLDAMNDEQRLQYQQGRDEGRNRVSVRKATAGFWEMRVLTVLIAFPFVEHLWAVWADTRWGWYSRGGIFEHCWFDAGREVCGVPAFPAPFDQWEGAILLSFFGITVVGAGLKAIAGAIAWAKNR